MADTKKRFDPSKAKFLLGLPRWKEDAAGGLPMVVVAGRSNVGKSSFINMMLKRKNLARTSSTPGRTQMLNFFDIDGKFVLVDVPGYGYAKAPIEEVRRWTGNVRDLITRANDIKLVIQLLDIRRAPSPEDREFADLVRGSGKTLLLVITKVDKEGRGKRPKLIKEIARAMGATPEEVVATSGKDGTGRHELWGRILELTGVTGKSRESESSLREAAIDVIAIDGPAGAGKSTVARAVAKALGWGYLDTGAMYRAVGLKADRLGISFENDEALKRMCDETTLELKRDEEGALKILLDGEDVSRQIRENRVSDLASRISARKPVRDAMGRFQREIGTSSPTVTEGRDMGTVIFPDAVLKIFLTASPEKRADRRVKDLLSLGQEANREKILSEMIKRDKADSGRAHAPLKMAEDGVLVDTDDLTPEEVVLKITRLLEAGKNLRD